MMEPFLFTAALRYSNKIQRNLLHSFISKEYRYGFHSEAVDHQ